MTLPKLGRADTNGLRVNAADLGRSVRPIRARIPKRVSPHDAATAPTRQRGSKATGALTSTGIVRIVVVISATVNLLTYDRRRCGSTAARGAGLRARASSPTKPRTASRFVVLRCGPVVGIRDRIGLFAVGFAHGMVLRLTDGLANGMPHNLRPLAFSGGGNAVQCRQRLLVQLDQERLHTDRLYRTSICLERVCADWQSARRIPSCPTASGAVRRRRRFDTLKSGDG